MNKIKTSIRKLKYNSRHVSFSLENIVLALAIILCLVWTYQSILAMSRNWELSERLTAERKALDLLKIEVETAELENQYYQTSEYQEILARKNLDKKNPGENMVVMPANSDAAKTKHKNTSVAKTEEQYSNFEKWWKFLFPSF